MPELTRNGNDVSVVGNQHTGNRMTKRMGIDMRQIMPFAEFAQPCGNAVRVHNLSVIPRKQKAGILPAVAVQLMQSCSARYSRSSATVSAGMGIKRVSPVFGVSS